MSSIFLRAHKSPFHPATAEETVRRHLIGNNVGNLIFSQAVHRLLSTHGTTIATGALTGRSPLPTDQPPQRLVLPLANAFRPGYASRLDRLAQIIDQAAVPVTVLGVGAQATLSGRRRHRDDTDRAVDNFVRAALRSGSGPIGVRGEFTREYLAGLGFGADDVTVIGCPSMFTRGPHLNLRQPTDALQADSRIALNISPYVAAMGPLSRKHAERYPRLTYLAQNQQTLELLLTGVYPAPPDAVVFGTGVPVDIDHPLIRQDRVRFFLDPTPWINHLAGYAFSFGTRIHGNIAALLAGTPAVVLAHDSRTAELAEYHDIPYRLITDHPERIDAAALHADADWSPLLRGHAGRWEIFRDFLHGHGLSTVYDPGEDGGAGFDARLAEVEFPPAVRTATAAAPEELYAQRRRASALHEEVTRLREQVRESNDRRVIDQLRRPAGQALRGAVHRLRMISSPLRR